VEGQNQFTTLNSGIKENIKIMAKRSELRREMEFHLRMFPMSTESIQDVDSRKLSQTSNFTGQNDQSNQQSYQKYMQLKISDVKLLNVKVGTKGSAVTHLHKLRPFGSVAAGWEVNLGNNYIRHTSHGKAP